MTVAKGIGGSARAGGVIGAFLIGRRLLPPLSHEFAANFLTEGLEMAAGPFGSN
jgi:hypothetical protein